MASTWGNADFSELLKLQERLQGIQRDVERFCQSAARELAARLLAKVIKRTPVGKKPHIADNEDLKKYWQGYVGGTLRRGWTSKTEKEAQNGVQQDGAKYARSLPVYRNGDVYTIVVQNPVKYASYVEFGHRQEPGRYVPALGKQLKAAWVEGQFMLTTSEQELRGQSPQILEKKLTAFLQEVFDGK